MNALFLSLLFLSNPFKIDYPEIQELSEQHYLEVQNKLRTIDTSSMVDTLYSQDSQKGLRKKQDFQGRIARGVRQLFVDFEHNKKPSQKLHKINKGGDYCIVSFASYNGIYDKLLQEIPTALEKTGFNGYFLSLLGAFPNPTGKEIQYAGVPYCFKIFALLEAQKQGFNKVLWIDAGLLPLRDPTPLFQWVEGSGCFFQSIKNSKRYLLSSTRDILLQTTGCDMYTTPCIRARIIGLDLKTEKAQSFIKDYYTLVEMGTPFLSCYPDEFVLGALLGKNPKLWPTQPFNRIVMSERKLNGKDRAWVQKQGYFFLLQHH